MKIWEETSYKLECRQTNEDCALQEFSELKSRRAPEYKTSFNPDFTFNLENPMERKKFLILFVLIQLYSFP